MKKFIILVTTFLISYNVFSQTEKFKPTPYIIGIVTMTSGDDLKNSTGGILGAGIGLKKIALEVNVGRTSFNFDKGNDSKYYLELRAMPFFSIGEFNGFGVFGAGTLFNTNHYFVEYGAGTLLHLTKKTDLSIQASIADNTGGLAVGWIRNF